MMTTSDSLDYFGTVVKPRSFNAWLQDVTLAIDENRRQQLFGHHNLHSLYQLHKTPAVAQFYQTCSDCYIDGVPVGWLLAAKSGNLSARQRFSLMDHFEDLLRYAQDKTWRVFYLGSTAQVCDDATTQMRTRYPNLDIRFQNGYFSDTSAIAKQINAFKPQLLLVGMGMPRQEQWLLQNIASLEVCIATQAGGTLDYIVGNQARPPQWISRLGFAWLYRLLRNPQRLWRRYLVEPWRLIQPTWRFLRGRQALPIDR